MPRKSVDACHVRRTEIQMTYIWSKVQVKTRIRVCHNINEWTSGAAAIESVAALLCKKARRRITGRVIIRGMVNTEITAETMGNGDIMFETQE